MDCYDDGQIINVGTGEDVSIADLANLVKEVVGYRGDIEFDLSKPDGTPRKVLDVSLLTATGWRYRTDLRTGIENTYRWFLDNPESRRS
jgi:GDP-L-fucose synthase